MITPIPPDTRTPGQVAYESDADCGEWKEQDKYTKDFWEVAAQAVIDHWRRTIVVTDEMVNAALDSYTDPKSNGYWKMGDAIRAALAVMP